jgi:hypothetical protein
MALDLLLIRQGQRPAAADPISLEGIESIRERKPSRPQSAALAIPGTTPKLFALLSVVFPHQTQYATVYDLLTAQDRYGLFRDGPNHRQDSVHGPEEHQLRFDGADAVRGMVYPRR